MASPVLLGSVPMPILSDPRTTSTSLVAERAVRILAKSMFKELRGQGYGDREIVQLANELLQQLVAEKRVR